MLPPRGAARGGLRGRGCLGRRWGTPGVCPQIRVPASVVASPGYPLSALCSPFLSSLFNCPAESEGIILKITLDMALSREAREVLAGRDFSTRLPRGAVRGGAGVLGHP